MTATGGGLVVRFASSSRRVCLVAGASLGTCTLNRRYDR